MLGKVVWFNGRKGFGFCFPIAKSGDPIGDSANNVFVHRRNFKRGLLNLSDNDEISFDLGEHDSRPCAVNVVLVKPAANLTIGTPEVQGVVDASK